MWRSSVWLIWFLFLSVGVGCQPAVEPPPTAVVEPTAPPATAPLAKVRLTNGEWPPYLSENLPHYGLASHITTAAFAQKGITVEYGFFPWARALLLAEEAEWDGSVVWYKTPEREELFYFSEPVIHSQDVFFHLQTFSFDWQEMSDLQGLRIGGTIEYDYGTAFREAEASGLITVDRVASDEQNFEKLLKGRIDVFIVELEVGLAVIRQFLTPEEQALITYHPTPVRNDPLHLILPRKVPGNEALIALFNEGLQELESSGQLQKIIEEARQPAPQN